MGIKKHGAHLKKQGKIVVPHFCGYVKTTPSKDLGPYDHDWWYVRVASIARRIYLRQELGVGRLRSLYGALQSKGSRPGHRRRAPSNIIRKVLQSLEKIGVVEKSINGGRELSDSGRRDLDL